ncbi:thiamine biosynthesis protein ApbE [Microvirga vignae]|uniref:FAD:protein FMN transferase n=1 Tax=Microvirga vignae TaxID=1225564 RepID=A0A0H1RCL4_9HYPH|nr:FAD:protein FMN transferase [Microvirga vignae]KLK92948.1 thiamine biosynthesis protein ApbE [Microvirga vignae]
MSHSFSRRRFIGITAAAAGLGLLPVDREAKAEAELVEWQGQVMGAMASLRIHHHDRPAANRLIERSVAEMRRFERIFSLYREDSALCTLNRTGMLVAPPAELVELLSECRRFADLTGGAFDPTVQALWTLYRDHFAKPGAAPKGPSESSIQAALERVSFDTVLFDRNRIVLSRPGMALTLNGIAQGYATDRVVSLLRQEGIGNSLVDMGESRAVGSRPDGAPWRIGIADPDQPERIGETLEVADQAVATSGSYGFRFDSAGRFNHLFDPRSGTSTHLHKSATVAMPTATAADALSTAFSLLPVAEISDILRRIGVGRVSLITSAGEKHSLAA